MTPQKYEYILYYSYINLDFTSATFFSHQSEWIFYGKSLRLNFSSSQQQSELMNAPFCELYDGSNVMYLMDKSTASKYLKWQPHGTYTKIN